MPRARSLTLLLIWLAVPLACTPGEREDPHAPWSSQASWWGARQEIEDLRIQECSGIVASRQHPGVWWVHNDSGDQARLFSMDAQGEILAEVIVEGAHNVDWEDLAIDEENRLYLCDMGNNFSHRQTLEVYVIDEPAPTGQERVSPLRTLRLYYPEQDQWPDPELRFDCEANFIHEGRLYVVTKHAKAGPSRIYRVEDMLSEQQQALVLVDEFDTGSQVTAADLSPDGGELAILSYEYIHLYALEPGSDLRLSRMAAVRIPLEARQCECISHEQTVLRVVNEQREIHLFATEAIRESGQRSSLEQPTKFLSPSDTAAELSRGYLPPRDSFALAESGISVLPLRKGFGETRTNLPAAPDTASVLLERDGSTLRVGLRWTPLEGGNDDGIQAWISWGPTSDRMVCGPEDQALRLMYDAAGRPALLPDMIAPHSSIPPHSLERRGAFIEGWIELPEASGPPGQISLSVVLLSPSGADWSFGGDSSMFTWRNPVLWGVLR